MRLLLDMHLSVYLASQLRDDGHDVFQLRERGLHRLDDANILSLAREEQRVIVTFDLDFSALLSRSGDSSPSLIQFRTQDTRTQAVKRLLNAILPIHEQVLAEGCILTVEPDRIRIRRLPLS